MRRINWKLVGAFGKGLCKVLAVGSLVILGRGFKVSVCEEHDEKYDSRAVGYGDAVEAIMGSNMFSDDKRDAVVALKHRESGQYYKAVIAIAESTAFSDDKLEMIEGL